LTVPRGRAGLSGKKISQKNSAALSIRGRPVRPMAVIPVERLRCSPDGQTGNPNRRIRRWTVQKPLPATNGAPRAMPWWRSSPGCATN
jgi:hypothetical protein